ncbi:MAG: [ribosomal protein S5]-alanine N-acetyltransferase [Fimbriimonadaceae bacterium]|nr:[ribosomal protein S5]-alanine N-acetyltransferase [Fimbriimonadaceae bacterium]
MQTIESKVEWKSGLPVITTERLILRIGDQSDIDSEIAFYRENEDHLGPWFPDSGRARLNRASLEQYVPEFRKRALHDQGYRFQLSLKTDPKRYSGVVSLARIQRGPEQTAILGYGIARILEGRGLMSEAVLAVLKFAFDDLDLHRIEAYYAPANERSGALLNRCGFESEGMMRGSLLINGQWVDHVLTSLINPNWRGTGRLERIR